MLTIRFIRTGKKNQPYFRLIVTDKRDAAKTGKFLEIVGSFDPKTKQKQLKTDRIKYWISVGAQPSPRAHNMFVTEGIIKADKLPVHKKAQKKEGEQAAASVPAAGSAKEAPKEEKKEEAKEEQKPESAEKAETK